MKRCPTCQRVYQDELSFCLEDGAPLMGVSDTSAEASETVRIPAPRLTNQSPTEVLPVGEAQPSTQPSPPFTQQRYETERTAVARPRSKALPWVLGGAVLFGIAGIVFGLMMMRGRDDSRTAENSVQSDNTTRAPESATATPMGQVNNPVDATTPAGETRDRTTTDRTSATQTPTPKPTQATRNSPVTVVEDEPPPPPPKPTPAPRNAAPISGGVLNGKAISLPRPPYPPIAKAARASGTVTVQVTIDESGKVISARAVGGHPLLQQAAVQAAYGARFSPTQLSGQPVKVTGVITYNFVAQ
jgi:TonB family protein